MGPRQVGKTTLSKSLIKSHAYYNYDQTRDINVFQKQEWDRSAKLVVFDELHKMRKWKLWLKGLYDEGATDRQHILVTGSARLDIAKKMGDSLAGRFFSFRLHPFDLKELKSHGSTEENYKKLLNVSGFPEPFMNGSERYYNLWQKSHSDLIIRQDLISLENIRDIDGIEMLTQMLRTRVGSTVSYNSLSEDLGRDDKTIKKWLNHLERMFIVFRLNPYSHNITRGIKKAGKYYFYDQAQVQGEESAQLENLVALALKKEIEYLEDCVGIPGQLYFVQTKDRQEIDFLVLQKKKKPKLIEVKLSDESVSDNFPIFQKFFPGSEKIQIVKNLHREFHSKTDVRVCNALKFLENLDLEQDESI
jgi:predicted AAA+ superfamily ATPase